ncbi:DUF5825 family protein [Nonomuraea sp. B10E15]|uniref:DUF5825 family protein n=1 Tax=Nonomuraea sp. B10E15 TaxID=3153560 RepID=UPI00325EDF1B
MTAPGSLTLTLWHHHDQELLRLPAVAMGSRRVGAGDPPAELAATLYHQGVRRVALDRPVDLTDRQGAATVVGWLLLLTELTSWALVVDWDVRLGPALENWRLLSHLYPPRAVLDSAGGDVGDDWREEFYLGKCMWRQGPGFVEVRDRRPGSLARYVIDDVDYLRAVDRLSSSCRADQVPAAVLDDLVSEGLVGQVGDIAWWMPYRVRRWPWGGMVI